MQRVCVFCGANPGARPDYENAARETGGLLARAGIGVVYGGGGTGMMGALADAALAAGGEVIGVIPDALVRLERGHRGVTEMRVVSHMHERKKTMYDLADGFMILPGGIGTFDELFEVLVWLHLGYHRKPCGLLNVAGFFDKLVEFLEHARAEKFLRATLDEIVIVEDNAARLLEKMRAFQPPPPPRWVT